MASAAEGRDDYACGAWKSTKHGWSAQCIVWSGYARAVTDCSNGKTIYGAWTGRGSWTFRGNCGKAKMVAQGTQWKKG